jgi:monoamine oxidase
VADLPDIDIAIVGGGVAGIYTGWRLLASPSLGSGLAALWLNRRDKLKVVLFEGSDRIGGRLLSARTPNFPDVSVELGGMRYVAPAQKLVTGLVERKLKLDWREQTVDVPGNIAYVRSRLLRTRDLANPQTLPYALDASEAAWLSATEARTPAALIERALLQIAPEIKAKLADGDIRAYLEAIKVDCLPLWRHGLWNLLAKRLSPDGYMAARTLVGYDSLGGNYNALDLALEFFDFTPDVSYRMVCAGYEKMPWGIQHCFCAAGGDIRFGQWLEGFVGAKLGDGSPGVELRFHDGTSLTARSIVLAMPRRSIELLRPEGEVLGLDNKEFRQKLSAVSGFPLFKMFLLYPNCWWQDAGVRAGRSLTDMPLRQVYYWPVGLAGAGSAPMRQQAGLVMVYDDLQNVDFWKGLDGRGGVHKAGVPVSRHGFDIDWAMFVRHANSAAVHDGDPFAARLIKNWEDHPPTRQMVAEIHRQLKVMHAADNAPEPTDAAYMDWSRDPYGGGCHFWNVNFESSKLLESMTQPVENFPCYICGEAYSTNQTWAEGALQTAEIVLQKRFGLPKPEWLHD